ncbi:outer membrane protein assembly factor BamB family protein [Kitasatospora purpeofusca]|uniref:outer membrane protein assembly factor BamB family protein n=1 Tax=Kitasatospora purpeofusca TaxID=67352 RepID=UPI0038111547
MTDTASGIAGSAGRAMGEAVGDLVRRRLSSQPDGRAAVEAFDAGPQEPAAQAELCRILVRVLSTEPPFAVELTALVPAPAPAVPPVPVHPPAPPAPPEPPRIGRDGIIIDGRSRNRGNLALGDQLIQNVRRGDARTVLILIAALALVVAMGYGGTKILTDDSPAPPAASDASGRSDAGVGVPDPPGEPSGGDPAATAGPSRTPASGSSDRSGPVPVRADPPTRFTPVLRENLTAADAAVVLDGADLITVTDGRKLQVTAVRDGRVLAAMTSAGRLPDRRPGDPSATDGVPGRPGVGASGDRRFAVAAFPLTVPGQGTTTDHYAVEVDILDLGSGKEAGRVRIAEGTASADAPTVAGVSEGRALVVVPSLTGPPTSYAVDLTTGSVVWTLPGFEALLVQGGTVTGASRTRVEGEDRTEVQAVSAKDGTVLWKALADSAGFGLSEFAGDKALVARGKTSTLLSTATGETLPLRFLDAPGARINDCWFDGRTTTVCSVGRYGGSELTGVDAAGGDVLWRIQSAAGPGERVAPDVTAAWHGAVYGRTQRGQDVVLDARTGQDRELSPGVAPYLVSEYAAVAKGNLYVSAG